MSPEITSKNQKIAMITGSSTGIGQAIARRLVQQGWSVMLHGRTRSEQLLATQQSIADQGGRAEILEADFLQTHQLESFVQRAWSKAGRIDAWINNAGGDVLTGGWAERSLEEKLEYLLKVDVTATLMLSRFVGQQMSAAYSAQQSDNLSAPLRAGHFSILNVGWDQAAQGMAGESGELFATTKGAIMAMTRSLAQSLAPAVRVNCLAPGWIQTEWGREASSYWQQRACGDSLMNRWGTPEDVAAVAGFLSSAEAGFISGQIVPVNGGFRYSA